jgi:predicted dehydrogenase
MKRKKELSRREVLKGAALAGVSVGLTGIAGAKKPQEPARTNPTMIGVPFEQRDVVRVGFIGVGGRGQGLLNDLLAIDGVEVKAICDIVPQRLAESQARIERRNKPKADEYGRDDTDYKRMLQRGDLDLVYIATPWDWHVPMAVDAMNAGIHAAVEVPVAVTMDECWQIVETSERTRKHCIILENCNYGYNELMVLNMCRDGLLGDLTHGEAAYIHDLRSLLLADSGEGLWRRYPHIERDGNLYPTHGLGPVAFYMNVNRGDRFTKLVSFSSRERSLTAYRDKTIAEGNPKRQERYICGDMNTSLLKTANGLTVMLQHDVVTPRPYSRLNLIQGTNGTFSDYPARIYVEGRSPGHRWEGIDEYKEQYEHDLWRRVGELARQLGGHGGMDFIMNYRLIECFKQGTPPDMDVYDAAAWSAPGQLSEWSTANDGEPQDFPDFTRGHWRDRDGVTGI